MIEYKKLPNTMSVDCSAHGFGSFYVLIVPENDENAIEEEYSFYLRHEKYCVMKYMFTCVAADLTDAAELAYYNAPDYIPDFIEECFTED